MINEMKVKADFAGWYYVTLFQYNKIDKDNPSYIRDWVEFDGEAWNYGGYDDNCYVCFIHKREKKDGEE